MSFLCFLISGGLFTAKGDLKLNFLMSTWIRSWGGCASFLHGPGIPLDSLRIKGGCANLTSLPGRLSGFAPRAVAQTSLTGPGIPFDSPQGRLRKLPLAPATPRIRYRGGCANSSSGLQCPWERIKGDVGAGKTSLRTRP